MKEIYEFRIWKEYCNLLSKPNPAKFNGAIFVIHISPNSTQFAEIEKLQKEVKEKYKESFFGFWNIVRKYTKQELDTANLFSIKILKTFEPAGEECGTIYDEKVACKICGSNRKQIGPLQLKKSTLPKKDIARTIAGEVIVSEKFVEIYTLRNLKGATFQPVICNGKSSGYFQLGSAEELALSDFTIAGTNPFDLSDKCGNEIYKCPLGHTIGLNLISEPYIQKSPLIGEYDFFLSTQKIGVKRGLLMPEPLYLCSPAFRKMIIEENLSGFDFEIARLE